MGRKFKRNVDVGIREEELEVAIILKALEAEPVPLADAGGDIGAYALLYTGPNRLYKTIAGGRPIYVGNADSLSKRFAEHRRSIDEVPDLDLCDFHVVSFLSAGKGLALMAEATLQCVFEPVWNATEFRGFGSRNQGRNRVPSQTPTAWDRIHPGRPWLVDRVSGPDLELRKEVRDYVSTQAQLSGWRIPGAAQSTKGNDALALLGPTNPSYRFLLSDSDLAVVSKIFPRRRSRAA